LPQTSTGTVTGTSTWFPDSRPELPLVRFLSPLLPGVAVAPPVQLATALPTALPQTSTGTVTGTETWFPDAIPCSPDVEPPEELSPFADAPPTHSEPAPPSTATELPQAFTGAVTGTSIWFPEARPFAPDVVFPGSWLEPDAVVLAPWLVPVALDPWLPPVAGRLVVAGWPLVAVFCAVCVDPWLG
jgi:hypothetical protein